MMKAWVLNAIGDIDLKDVDMPVPGENEVLIRVKAAGICGSDIPRIYETGAHKMPLIPGHEFSGSVEGIGKEVSAHWLGKRVAVFPKIACGKCANCRKGRRDLCTDYDYLGSRGNGAFAEYVSAPADNLQELPGNVSFEQAAMLEPLAVAANAVRRGVLMDGNALPKENPVAVCGLGSIGFMVVMLLYELGYSRIFVVGNKDSQRSRAEGLGIAGAAFYDSRNGEAAKWLKEVSDGGVSAYFECVGSNESIAYGIEAAASQGRLVLVGNPRSDMAFSRDTYWEILRKQMNICGIWNSAFCQTDALEGEDAAGEWSYVLKLLADGRLSPEKLISHRLPLHELGRGFVLMREKSEDYCKVMMES